MEHDGEPGPGTPGASTKRFVATGGRRRRSPCHGRSLPGNRHRPGRPPRSYCRLRRRTERMPRQPSPRKTADSMVTAPRNPIRIIPRARAKQMGRPMKRYVGRGVELAPLGSRSRRGSSRWSSGDSVVLDEASLHRVSPYGPPAAMNVRFNSDCIWLSRFRYCRAVMPCICAWRRGDGTW